MDIKDRVVVVTGGASGIGAAMCKRFAQGNAHAVVVADLNGDDATAVAQSIGNAAIAMRADVTQESDVKHLVQTTLDRFGRIDVFCSNAGVALGHGADASDMQWAASWGVNVLAHVYAARAVLPHMLERGQGYLVQTASAAGLLTQVDSAPYSVTKHAAVGFAEWLAINYGDQGIRVSCLCPQGVVTPMLMGAGGDRKSFLTEGAVTPEHVADEVVKAMQEERFLVLPHPQVLTYLQRKTGDYDRWIAGMRKVRDRARAARGTE